MATNTSSRILLKGVLLLCLVGVYRQPCDAVASSSMVCGSEVMVDKQTVEPLEWWPDEKDPCPPDQWLCKDRKNCIPRNATCSSTEECEDGSDESPRFCGCKEDEFHCGDLCIKCSQRCDKVKHCVHGEDEQDCLTHTCPSNFFQCVSDGVCVPQKAMCNHTSECADSSDEDHCQRFRSCYSSEFRCDNAQCVRPFAVCDDYQDCADNSDEKECQPSDFVTCTSGKKIHKFWWCNNFPDCSENYHADDTDELNCTCGEEHFRCHNSRCIFKGNVCDSKCDCQGCEDEVDCRHVYVNDSGVTECLKGKSVECNGRCIAKEFICDGIRHCYGEDLTEFGCYDYKNKMFRHPAEARQKQFSFFQCKDLRSLPSILLCDGQRHCLDGEDEEHCGEEGACGPKQFRCLNGSCIPDKAKCDGIEDCELGFDEMHCKDQTDQAGCTSDEWRCVRIGQCIPRSGRCDSNPNCIDGSDELYCANNTCGEDQWRCFSGHCVSKSAHCDSVFDCKDKSDEKYCDEYKCRPGTMKCKSGQCVATEAWCNGTKECPDGSDEQKCVPRECHSDEFRCANGQCVPLSHRCHVFFDPRDSCLDLSHHINCTEAPCGKGKIKCFRGPCIDEELRCDGRAQCPLTWDDENNCPFRCSGAGDKCGCLDQEVKCFNLSLTEFPTVENNINKYLFAYNRIGETFDQKRIEGHSNVVFLDLCYNHITNLGNGTMSELHMLMTLLLCNNNITTITYGNFKGLTNLRNLDLTMNQISSIGPRGFDGLSTLPKLDLRHQYLVKIAENAFMGLTSLKILLLSHNRLTHITHPDTFAGLPSLETLLLSHNRLKTISSPNTFVGSPRLSTLVVDENPLEYVDQMLFEPLYNLTKLSTPEFRFCCLPHHAEECLPHTEEFSSCEDLMSNLVLRVFVWVVGFVALVGNTFVIVWRLMYPSGSKKNHSMLFVNLAIGDLMMGVYLLIIAGIDLKHRGVYRLHEKEWRSSPLCQFAGFLSTFSSEASVFTLTVITLDRLTILLSPYGIRRVHEGLAKRVMVGVWLVAFLLAAVPLFDVPYFKDFYGRSGVCLALHITNDKPNGWEYSVFIFIVLNLLSFMIIAISYVRIYVGARDTPLMECGRNKHGKDREMGLRVTYIVGTDAACWLPIILLGIFSLSGIKIPRKVFAWVAVFVLPFNAALNPLLYTFFTDPVRKRLKIMRESISSLRTRSTRSSVVSGVRMTSTYRGRVTTEVTDIPVPVSDGKVHTKAAICVYTPTATAATQVTHFIHDPPDHEAKKVDDRPNQNGNDAKQILDCTDPGSDAEREAIIPLETLTADRPAALRTSGRYGRKKNTADQRYD